MKPETKKLLIICGPSIAATAIFVFYNPDAFKTWGWVAMILGSIVMVTGAAFAIKYVTFED